MHARQRRAGPKMLRVAAIAVVAAAILAAQSNRATISGVVTDKQGGVVPGATVTASDIATGVKTTITTNDAGFYSIPNLPVGQYTLSVEREGFRRYVRQDVVLTTGETLGLDITIELGAVSESVTISSAAPLIETRTSDMTQLVESASIRDLPLADRRTMNIINLIGASVFIGFDGNQKPNFSLAGGRTQSQMFWIDGGTGQNIRMGVAQMDMDPPVDTVEEIKVLSNNYAAEYGGSAGGVVVETTKSGTNQFHGSAFEYLRNNAMDAPGYFAPVQNGSKLSPELRYNVFGTTLGGPVRKDKTFFFFGFQGQRRRTGDVDTLTVPTPLQRSGDFSQTFDRTGKLVPIYDPATTAVVNGQNLRVQFPGNTIPSSRLDPVALKAVTFYPQPNRPPDSITGANNFRQNFVTGLSGNFFLAKVDHNISEKDRLTGRYLYNSGNTSTTSVYPDPAADPRTFPNQHEHDWYGSWTHIFGATLVNDFRFIYDTRLFHNLSHGLGGDYPQKLGLQGVDPLAFPQFVPAGFTALGSNAQERRQYPIEQYQIVNNTSWVRGKHALKFGWEARRSRDHEINLPTASGSFTFSTLPTGLPGNASTGNGLASMLLGFPSAFSANQTAVLDRHTWYLAGFVQDDWTVSRDLTLNFGVRWEADTPMVDSNNLMNGFDPTQLNPVSGTPGVVKFMGVNGFRSTPYDGDWNNFGPRAGFAWKPFGAANLVIRGGYGIFYAIPFDAASPTAAALGFSTSTARNSPDNGITAPFYLRDGVPGTGATAPQLNDAYGAVPAGGSANTSVPFFETNRRTGYSQQFNLSVQRELPGSMVIQVSGLGNLGRKLANANISMNQIPPQLLGPAHQSQKDRPFPQFSDVMIVAPPTTISNYYAGMVRFEKRYAKGLNLVGSYTRSKFLDNSFEAGTTLGQNGGPYSNYYNRKADYGASANDIQHRFSFSSVYELPFGSGKRWLSANPLRYVIGNWALGNVTVIQSGPPFTVTTQTNTTNSFSSGALRANVLRNPLLSSPGVAEWFDITAFAQPAPFQFGNEGVGILRAPGTVNCDFSVMRNFAVRERLALQVRGEFFNAFNHTNLGVPGRIYGGPGFGVVTSAGPARQIQIGARLSF